MELCNREDEIRKLLKGEAHLWNRMLNFINMMSLKCAVQLGIPDAIHNHGRPIPLSDLVAVLSIPSSKTACFRRLMRLLVHDGIFANQNKGDVEGEEDSYLLTPASRVLLKESAYSMSSFMTNEVNSLFVMPWNFLGAWFQQTELTTFEMAHGLGFWDLTSRQPEFGDSFNEIMATDSRLVMNILVNTCGEIFQGLRSLVDVGGGTGVAAMAISQAFPHIKCTVFDLPNVIASVHAATAITHNAGDMFESIPHGDAILLKWILHDWSDENCVKILKKCKEAIPSKEKGGKVIMLEIVLDSNKGDHKETETQLFFDMLMMVSLGGQERSELEWRKIFWDAGFTDYKITPLPGVRSIIEVYP